MDYTRELVEYAKKFIGIPYKWGGQNPLEGFDCSGYIQEITASIGIDPRGDQTAQGLYYYWAKHGVLQETVKPGCILFFGKDLNKITHVALAVNNFQMIEAAGGDSKTKTIQDAKKKGACVRIRPWNARVTELKAAILPKYH